MANYKFGAVAWSPPFDQTETQYFGYNVETLIPQLPNCTYNVLKQWESKVIKYTGGAVHCKLSAQNTNWEPMFQVL